MQLKNVEKKEKNTAVFEVETDAAEFEKAVNAAYLKNRSSISIPGFRKGKAPRAVIEGMYGREVFYQDAMDELAPTAYEFGLKESGLGRTPSGRTHRRWERAHPSRPDKRPRGRTYPRSRRGGPCPCGSRECLWKICS